MKLIGGWFQRKSANFDSVLSRENSTVVIAIFDIACFEAVARGLDEKFIYTWEINLGHVHTNMRIFLHESAFLPHEISDPKPQFFEAAFQNNLRPNQDNKYIYICGFKNVRISGDGPWWLWTKTKITTVNNGLSHRNPIIVKDTHCKDPPSRTDLSKLLTLLTSTLIATRQKPAIATYCSCRSNRTFLQR